MNYNYLHANLKKALCKWKNVEVLSVIPACKAPEDTSGSIKSNVYNTLHAITVY
jgi:hypothetical protein